MELAKKINKPASATDGQVLTYNGTSNEWEAKNPSASITEPTDLEKGIIGGDEWVNGGSYTIGKSVVIDENKLYLLVGDGGSTTKPSADTAHSIWEETSISKLNSSLNVRYNPETDYIQVRSDGQWVNYKNVGLLSLIVFKDGKIYGGSFIKGNNKGLSYELSNSNLVLSRPSSTYGTLLTNGMLDFSNYNKITIVVEKIENFSNSTFRVGLVKDTTKADDGFVNGTSITTTGTYEISVSNINESYYFVMAFSNGIGGLITISKIIVS